MLHRVEIYIVIPYMLQLTKFKGLRSNHGGQMRVKRGSKGSNTALLRTDWEKTLRTYKHIVFHMRNSHLRSVSSIQWYLTDLGWKWGSKGSKTAHLVNESDAHSKPTDIYYFIYSNYVWHEHQAFYRIDSILVQSKCKNGRLTVSSPIWRTMVPLKLPTLDMNLKCAISLTNLKASKKEKWESSGSKTFGYKATPVN